MRSFAITALAGYAAAERVWLLAADQYYSGLETLYYEGSWDSLPYFTTLEPSYKDIVADINYGNEGGNEEFGTAPLGEHIAVSWEGWLKIPADGMWTFRTESDDGSDFWLGDEEGAWHQIVDNNGLHGIRAADGEMELTQGWYPIWASYFNKTGHHAMIASMEGPGFPMQPIPAEYYMHGGQDTPPYDIVPRANDDTSSCVEPNYNELFDQIVSRMTWSELAISLQNEDLERNLAEQYADTVSLAWYNYKRCMNVLPVVCDAGKECRNEIRAAANIVVTQEWYDAFERVRTIIEDSWHVDKKILVDGYKEEFLCEAGCYCEEIETTYIDHVRLEREIEREIDVVQEDIERLIQKQKDILVNCPEYEETMVTVDEQYLI